MRQRVVEKATAEIQEALSRQDASLARNLAASALEKFPDNPSLLDLKASMDRQIEVQRGERIAEIRATWMAGEFDRAEQQLVLVRRELGESSEFERLAEEIQAARSSIADKSLRQESAPGGRAQSSRRPVLEDSDSPSWQSRQRSSRGGDLPLSAGTNLRTARQRPEDHSVAELTPLAGIEGPELTSKAPGVSGDSSSPGVDFRSEQRHESRLPSAELQPAPGNVLSGWTEQTLKVVEKQLANFIGPLAKLAVKRASARTADLDELYQLLAANVANPGERRKSRR
jgi:hypothetical protein